MAIVEISKQNPVQKSTNQRFVWDKLEPMPKEIVVDYIEKYLQSQELKRLESYARYYDGENPEMVNRYLSRKERNKTPNVFLPTGYYSTIVSSMSGFMFQNVKYNELINEQYAEELNIILRLNDIEVKDMVTGTRSLTFNKGSELVYTVGDVNKTEIKFTSIDPRQMIFIYNTDIEPEVVAGIYIRKSYDDKYDYDVDVIYKDLWQFFYLKEKELSQRELDRELFFSECPVIEYRTDIMNDNSPFNVALPYIDALDFIMSGNSNEIDRLVDALLVIGKIIKDEDLEHMEEWKVLQGMKTEDRAEYITKDMSPQFREYVSKLLINEIHKHCHVIDWYSPDSGLTGEVSAKALITRLFDMDMYSKQLEKIYMKGLRKRIRIITELMKKKGMQTGEVEIILNRTLPNMMIDTAQALKDIPFIDDVTKLELVGLDANKVKERMSEQKQEFDISDMGNPITGKDIEDEEV